MNQTRIFISYTSRDERSKTVSKTLFECLNDAGFAAWRDVERLQHGEKWHAALTKNLVGSHAGVVLLTPEALESEWVLKEATYLKVRADGSPDFKVVAALLGDLAPQDLRAAACPFKVLHFPEDQLICLPDTDVPDAVIKALEDVKALWEATRPEEQLIENIAVFLKKVEDEKILLRLARVLKLKLDDWFPDGSMKETLARELARLMTASDPRTVAHAIGQVVEHIEVDDAQKILQCIHPFGIEAEGARHLADMAGAVPPGGVAGLNARDPRIGILYLRRASGTLAGWRRVEINGLGDPEGDGTDLIDQVRQALVNKWGLFDEEELKEELPHLQHPYFVIIPSAVDETALRQLRADLGSLCYLVLSSSLDSGSPLCRRNVLRFLAPPLAADAEERVLKGYERACKALAEHYEALDDF